MSAAIARSSSADMLREHAPTNEGGDLERFDQKFDQKFEQSLLINSLRLTDPHEARALELELLGQHRRAANVRACSINDGKSPKWTCKQPCCPTCSEIRAAKHARVARAAVSRMGHPILGLYTWFVLPETLQPRLRLVGDADSRTNDEATDVTTDVTTDDFEQPNGLRLGISALRDAHRRLRRRTCFSRVLGGVGGIETKISDDGRAFDLHLHEVLDAELIDEGRVSAAWNQLTGGRGSFKLKELDEHEGDAEHRPLLGYITKAASWCPPAGGVGLNFLSEIQHAIHGRRLLVAWGTGEIRHRTASAAEETT